MIMLSSRSVTWLLFISLPLMALARRSPNGAVTGKIATRQVWLKISVVFLRDDSLSQGSIIRPRLPKHNSNVERIAAAVTFADDARRKLEGMPQVEGGVGSKPPNCSDRCGICTPCIPVVVPVEGAKTDDEYYPEVWRCQCDNKLYIP